MARYIFCQIVLEEGILLQMFTGLSAGTATNDKISFLPDAKKYEFRTEPGKTTAAVV